MTEVIVIGAGPNTASFVKLIVGPVAQTGPVILEGKTMFGHSSGYDYRLDARDKKIAKLRSRLSLAYASRNKPEVTRLTRELHRLGQSW